MQHYQHLGDGVYHLDSHYIQPGVASLYCVLQDGEVAIIETGTARSLPFVEKFLADLEIAPQQVKYIIPTHVHLDHAGGAGVMMRAFTEAQLVIHPAGARHMIDPAKLIGATQAVYGAAVFDKIYGEIPPVEEARIIIGEHASIVDLNGRKLQIIDTPGHAYHHFCVVDETSRGIFSGDTFGLSYPNLLHNGKRVVLPTTTPTQFDPQALHKSIDLLMSFQPARMYLTHFNELPDPASVVDQYQAWVEKYVALTERLQPGPDDLPSMFEQMGEMIAEEFDFSAVVIGTQLSMDIKLNCQGLIYWYQKHHD
jgi:glyoxylase-like metal-dependent hydrolase (beta-lactamase superfamily II)